MNDFEKLVADVKSLADNFEAAKDDTSPAGHKLSPGEIAGLVILIAKIGGDVVGLLP